MKWEKIFVNELSYNALYLKYTNNSQNSIWKNRKPYPKKKNKNKKQQNKTKREREWEKRLGRGPKQTFLQRTHTDGKSAHEKLTKLLITRSILIKTTISYHLTLVRMAIIKTSTNNKCWRRCGEN